METKQRLARSERGAKRPKMEKTAPEAMATIWAVIEKGEIGGMCGEEAMEGGGRLRKGLLAELPSFWLCRKASSAHTERAPTHRACDSSPSDPPCE